MLYGGEIGNGVVSPSVGALTPDEKVFVNTLKPFIIASLDIVKRKRRYDTDKGKSSIFEFNDEDALRNCVAAIASQLYDKSLGSRLNLNGVVRHMLKGMYTGEDTEPLTDEEKKLLESRQKHLDNQKKEDEKKGIVDDGTFTYKKIIQKKPEGFYTRYDAPSVIIANGGCPPDQLKSFTNTGILYRTVTGHKSKSVDDLEAESLFEYDDDNPEHYYDTIPFFDGTTPDPVKEKEDVEPGGASYIKDLALMYDEDVWGTSSNAPGLSFKVETTDKFGNKQQRDLKVDEAREMAEVEHNDKRYVTPTDRKSFFRRMHSKKQ